MIAILVFGFIVLSAICLWLLIEGRKSPKFLIWFIPALLVLVSSTYVTYTSILGFPKVDIPKQRMSLWKELKVNQKKESLWFWVKEIWEKLEMEKMREKKLVEDLQLVET